MWLSEKTDSQKVDFIATKADEKKCFLQQKQIATPLPQTSHTIGLASSTSSMVNCIRKKADRNGKALYRQGFPVPAYLRRFPPILSPSAKRRSKMERANPHRNPPAQPPEGQAVLKACALYALNDLLLREGKISEEKKQAVDFEIWKQYRF